MSSSSLFASLGAALQSIPSPRFSLRISSPTVRSHPLLNAFEAELALQLEQLKLVDESGYLSLPWLCQAMGVVLSTHSNVQAFVPALQQALAEDNKWLAEYLDDSIKLLDICIVLTDTINDIKNYHTFVELAVHSLEKGVLGEAQLRRAKNAMAKCTEALKRKDEEFNPQGQKRSKLETCSSILRRMGEKLNVEDASKGNFFSAMYAAQITTIFICGVLTAALCFKPRRPFSSISVTGQTPWVSSLSSLQQTVKEKVDKKKAKGSSALLEELDKADLTVRSLQELVEKILVLKVFPLVEEQAKEIRQTVERLRTCADEMETGLAPLEQQIGELYRLLIASRVVLLNIYSHSCCSSGGN
eukprot:c27617_g2_i1 orf=1050-2123(-)